MDQTFGLKLCRHQDVSNAQRALVIQKRKRRIELAHARIRSARVYPLFGRTIWPWRVSRFIGKELLRKAAASFMGTILTFTTHAQSPNSMLRHYAMRILQLVILIMAFTTSFGSNDLPVFRPLPDSAARHMERQRTFVASLVSTNFPGERITGTEKDFALLQQILDAKLLQKTQTWELQSLGIVFGDALTKRIPGLHWMEVTDSYGTDPALLYLDTTLQLNPLTMLSKRIEADKPVDVAKLVLVLVEYVEKKATKVGKRNK